MLLTCLSVVTLCGSYGTQHISAVLVFMHFCVCFYCVCIHCTGISMMHRLQPNSHGEENVLFRGGLLKICPISRKTDGESLKIT